MAKKTLTAVALRGLKPRAVAFYVSDAKQDGLRVRVSPAGTLTWSVVYRVKDEGVCSMSLGKGDPDGKEGLSLEEARSRAAGIVKAARQGRNLAVEEREAREVKREALTVEGLIELYGKHISSSRRSGGPLRTAAEIERRLKRMMKTRLGRPADSLRRADLSRLLDEVADKYPREAEKRRQCAHAMFKWAMAKGYVAENPLAGTPAYGAGDPRDRVLDHNEVRTLWQWLDAGAAAMPTDVIAALRLQLLLGSRCGEVAGMAAEEITMDGERMVWTLPANRSKNGKPRVTPLGGRARSMVESAVKRRATGALFRTVDGSRALSSSDVGQALLNRKLPVPHFTTHDLRRTVVSQLDELGVSLDTIAAVVGHQRGTAATRVLLRHYSRPNLDPRLEAALATWEKHLDAIVAAKATLHGNVIAMFG